MGLNFEHYALLLLGFNYSKQYPLESRTLRISESASVSDGFSLCNAAAVDSAGYRSTPRVNVCVYVCVARIDH